MQHTHQISRYLHQMRTSTDATTRIVAFSPRHIALYHLKHFAKVSIVVAATIVALLYTVVLVIGVPTVNM
jgi:hypothetical protein